MKAINSIDRRKAFQRFLLFFILTISLLVTTIFVGTRVPYSENKKLREQIALSDSEQVFKLAFLDKMRQAQGLIDTVNLVPSASGLIDGRITQKIQEMDAMLAQNATINNKDIYAQIIKTLNNAKSDKALLRAAANKDSVVALYNQQIQDLKNSLAKWQESYKQLEMQNLILRQH